MKKTFTLYHELLDTPNTILPPEVFLCENKITCRKSIQDGPSKMVMHNLINYAKALSVKKTKNAGTVNLVMN